MATDEANYHQFTSTFQPIAAANVEQIEDWIDELGAEVELPPNFIIPGASPTSGALDLARSALRGAERRVVALDESGMLPNPEILQYVNRLADLLFMMARYVDRELPIEIVTGTRIEAD